LPHSERPETRGDREEMTERYYNCGKEQKITEMISNIEKIEVDLK